MPTDMTQQGSSVFSGPVPPHLLRVSGRWQSLSLLTPHRMFRVLPLAQARTEAAEANARAAEVAAASERDLRDARAQQATLVERMAQLQELLREASDEQARLLPSL